MAGLEGDTLNKADGTRKWHRRVTATIGENGLYLWLGEDRLKAGVRGVPFKNATSAENGFYNPSQYFTSYAIGNKLQGYKYYVQDPDSGKLIHPDSYCGSVWIGIARVSSEPTPSDKWDNWTHVMHWNPRFFNARDIPRPEEIFEAISIMTKKYPDDVRDLTNQIIAHFKLGNIDEVFLVEFFPWLDRRLGTKPR